MDLKEEDDDERELDLFLDLLFFFFFFEELGSRLGSEWELEVELLRGKTGPNWDLE